VFFVRGNKNIRVKVAKSNYYTTEHFFLSLSAKSSISVLTFFKRISSLFLILIFRRNIRKVLSKSCGMIFWKCHIQANIGHLVLKYESIMQKYCYASIEIVC